MNVRLDFDPIKEEELYIIGSVKDIGKGLSPEEADALFIRFSQGSPRTHIQYGGNGLGLFISRRIAELHGGAIGFSSESDRGSVFSFYIKLRRPRSNTEISPELSISNNLQSSSPSRDAEIGRQHKLDSMIREHVHVLVVEGKCSYSNIEMTSIGMSSDMEI